MKGLIAALVLLAGAAQADDASVEGVIGGQIEAFKADDFETAFTFAAPNIRGIFGNPQRFGQMVRQRYPMVWQPGSVEYLDGGGDGSVRTQDVLITDSAGRLYKLEYTLIETADGWKIAGVEVLTAPEVGV